MQIILTFRSMLSIQKVEEEELQQEKLYPESVQGPWPNITWEAHLKYSFRLGFPRSDMFLFPSN